LRRGAGAELAPAGSALLGGRNRSGPGCPRGNLDSVQKLKKVFVFSANLSLMVTFCSAPLYSLPLH